MSKKNSNNRNKTKNNKQQTKSKFRDFSEMSPQQLIKFGQSKISTPKQKEWIKHNVGDIHNISTKIITKHDNKQKKNKRRYAMISNTFDDGTIHIKKLTKTATENTTPIVWQKNSGKTKKAELHNKTYTKHAQTNKYLTIKDLGNKEGQKK